MRRRSAQNEDQRAAADAAARAVRRRRDRRDLRRIAAVAATFALTIGAGIASAQLDDPGAGQQLPDTEYTPTPRDGEQLGWHMEGGALFGKDELVSNSWTPYTVDFYSLKFFSDTLGFAAGAACPDGTPFDKLDECTRVPVVYEYTQPEGENPTWREVYRGDGKGYIAAMAFIGPDRAIAVGGDGDYPKTEPADNTTSDPAGKARAWEWNAGSWTEIHDLPKDMGALTALDVSPRPSDCKAATECALAGGLKQMWTWKDGAFSKDAITPATVTNGDTWRFRVRDLKFAAGEKAPPLRVVATTSGCCDMNPVNNTPRLLWFDGTSWSAVHLQEWDAGQDHAETLPDSWFSLGVGANGAGEQVASVLATPGGATKPGDTSRIVGQIKLRALNPAANGTDQNPSGPANAVLAPIGGESDNSSSDVPNEVANPRLTDLRLAAASGDVAGIGTLVTRPPVQADDHKPDGFLDWGVGEFTSTEQGGAYTTLEDPRGAHPPLPIDCPGNATQPQSCQAQDATQLPEKTKNKAIYALPSYGLNAFTYSDTSGSTGWAVGDKGALLRLGFGGTAGAGGHAPEKPDLGQPEQQSFSDTEAYDPYRPVGHPAPAGPVPALSTRPLQDLATPRLLSVGSPDPTMPATFDPENVSTIVMSRSGDEGWALGSKRNSSAEFGTTLYHYVDGRWTRCETDPVGGGQVPADPACASLAALRRSPSSYGGAGVWFFAMARVPFERDGDPANDDDFEVVAVGSTYGSGGQPPAVIARYRDGRWSLDHDAMDHVQSGGPLTSVAFVRPDEGWVLDGTSVETRMWRFHDGRWSNCQTDKTDLCRNMSTRLPQDNTTAGSHWSLATAGNRVYLAGNRKLPVAGATDTATTPVILYYDATAPCNLPTDRGCWQAADGGYDPGWTGSGCSATETQGLLTSFTVVQNRDGSYSGWALMGTGGQNVDTGTNAALLHLQPGNAGPCGSDGGSWVPWRKGDAIDDYVLGVSTARPGQTAAGPPYDFQIVALPGDHGDGEAFVALAPAIPGPNGAPALRFDPGAARWRVLPTAFTLRTTSGATGQLSSQASIDAIAPDGVGGIWVAAHPKDNRGTSEAGFKYQTPTFFYRYAHQQREPIFDDVPHPIREQITSTAAGGDGSFWVTTSSAAVYRYDRLTGWERIGIKGWNAARVVTRDASANAIAVGPDGRGIAVGEGGRIADVTGTGGILDAVSGIECTALAKPGCSTTEDLEGAAIAPDGSALAVGDGRTVLWRPAGGEFQAVTPPSAAPAASLTAVTMPTASRAWITSNTGQVFVGTRNGDDWSWRTENRGPGPGNPVLNRGPGNRALPLHAISVTADGEGYAVGDRGLVLRRTGDAAFPWKRIQTGFLDDFTSLALSDDGAHLLVGGDYGLILTGSGDQLAVARPADPYDPLVAALPNFPGRVVGLALLPGDTDGEVEAWAAEQVPYGKPKDSSSYNRSAPPNAILHYSSNPDDTLLNAGTRVKPLPDTPLPRPGELSFAAFGKSDCHFPSSDVCHEPTDGNLQNDAVARAVTDDIIAASKRPGGPQVALFTGDVSDGAGKGGTQGTDVATPADVSVVHKRWAELVAKRFADAGVPLFGALGGNDLGSSYVCTGNSCPAKATAANNLGWRQALADMPAPWGSGPDPKGVSITPVADDGIEAPGGGARTHYAFDIKSGDGPATRVVVADSSLRGMNPSDGQQNPVGSQSAWLQDALNRPDGERAVVLTNRPSFSYGPGATSDVMADATQFETLMSRYGVSAVVSGHLGWNALYYACGVGGVHYPQIGGAYPTGPPQSARDCVAEQGNDAQDQATELARQTADQLQGAGVPLPPDPTGTVDSALGMTPYVIASGAGGKFGPSGDQDTSTDAGYWFGYSVVRVAANGDPRATIVEQRPVVDWIGVTAKERTLGAGQRVTLSGYGRQPAGTDQPIRYVSFNDPSVTHRWDLVQADREKPYMPRRDADGQYVPLDTSVATIDSVSGQVKAGRGRQDRTYAIAILSVGDKAASYPMVFLPSKAHPPSAPAVLTSAASLRTIAPTPSPAVRVLGTLPASLPSSTPPPAGAPPVNANVALPPPPPAPPVVPPVASPTPSPPPPPAPPPPPPAAAPLALSLTPKVGNISIQATVLPPTPPPVNPAPPSGGAARKEAKQRQAAVAKSESASEGGEQAGEAHGRIDAVDSPNASMTRRDPAREAHFSAIVHRDQPSAWSRGALYGGGLALMALTLALGFTSARPTPRRRPPEVPAPAWARRR